MNIDMTREEIEKANALLQTLDELKSQRQHLVEEVFEKEIKWIVFSAGEYSSTIYPADYLDSITKRRMSDLIDEFYDKVSQAMKDEINRIETKIKEL